MVGKNELKELENLWGRSPLFIGPQKTSRFCPKLVIRNDPEYSEPSGIDPEYSGPSGIDPEYSGSSPDRPEYIRNNPEPFRNPNGAIFEVTSESVRNYPENSELSGMTRKIPDEI